MRPKNGLTVTLKRYLVNLAGTLNYASLTRRFISIKMDDITYKSNRAILREYDAPLQHCEDAMNLFAGKNRFHPLKDYLETPNGMGEIT